LLIALYVFDNVLMYLNIKNILIKQGRYKTYPLLFFYIFSLISLTFRVMYLIWQFSMFPFVSFMINISVIAKLCVGMIQSWMILKIVLRLRQSSKENLNPRK